MKKIGIFGGSFNPIHNSHIKIIDYLIDKRIVDEVWLIPCKKHAFNKELASSSDRINMMKLAIKNNEKARINLIEMNSKGKNYTITTIRKLKKKYDYDFLLIVGADITSGIKKWKDYKELLQEASFILFQRPGYKIKNVKGMRIIKIIKKIGNISSTEIRENIKHSKSISSLVPREIERYIKQKKLYR